MTEPELLGTCDDFNSPHEYSAMTCKHWEPVASPQATRPKDRMRELAEFAAGSENYEETVNSCSFLAAQPAAGTTPQAERPVNEDDTYTSVNGELRRNYRDDPKSW